MYRICAKRVRVCVSNSRNRSIRVFCPDSKLITKTSWEGALGNWNCCYFVILQAQQLNQLTIHWAIMVVEQENTPGWIQLVKQHLWRQGDSWHFRLRRYIEIVKFAKGGHFRSPGMESFVENRCSRDREMDDILAETGWKNVWLRHPDVS